MPENVVLNNLETADEVLEKLSVKSDEYENLESTPLTIDNSIMNVAAQGDKPATNEIADQAEQGEAQQFDLSKLTPEQLARLMPKKPVQQVREYPKIRRNDPCPCGSGKKYKNCCLQSGKYEGLKNAR